MSESFSEPPRLAPIISQATSPDAASVFTKIFEELPNCVQAEVSDMLRTTLFPDGKKRWAAALELIRACIAADD